MMNVFFCNDKEIIFLVSPPCLGLVCFFSHFKFSCGNQNKICLFYQWMCFCDGYKADACLLDLFVFVFCAYNIFL